MPSVSTSHSKNTISIPEGILPAQTLSNKYGSLTSNCLPAASHLHNALDVAGDGANRMGPQRQENCAKGRCINCVGAGSPEASRLGIGSDEFHQSAPIAEGSASVPNTTGSDEHIVGTCRLTAESKSPSQDDVLLSKASLSTSDGVPGSESENTRYGVRVSEHETSVVGFRRKEERMQLGGKSLPGDNFSPISKLPNEVLIHTFSFLDPSSLSTLMLVCKRFNSILTSSHVWRSAFVRYFTAQPPQRPSLANGEVDARVASVNDRRYFTRLRLHCNWKTEYLARTSLLRSLFRGKSYAPTTPSSRDSGHRATNAGSIITYPAVYNGSRVTHISANFPPRSTARPHLLHASLDSITVTSSDPATGKLEKQPRNIMIPRAPVLFQPPNDPAWLPGSEIGLGVIDLSEELGYVYGETTLSGRVFVNAFTNTNYNSPHLGYGVFLQVPEIRANSGASITSLWIAKKRAGGVFETTGAKCGVLYGDSKGVVVMHALPTTLEEKELGRWTIAAKCWAISPGVPIIAIKVDEEYTGKRKRSPKKYFPAVALNALGEVYTLRNLAHDNHGEWILVEPSRRRLNTLSKTKLLEANLESESMMNLEWEKVSDIWAGWRMDYRLIVDFAERNIVVVRSKADFGHAEESVNGSERIKRYHLRKSLNLIEPHSFVQRIVIHDQQREQQNSGFQAPLVKQQLGHALADPISSDSVNSALGPLGHSEDIWQTSEFEFSYEMCNITTVAMDMSNIAVISSEEDILVENTGRISDVPGLRARLFAVGTSTGHIFIWDIRNPMSLTGAELPKIQPLRIIQTESPQITAIGLSSLYLIHGGNDGLVQCWDPLSSTLNPIRTIHSPFSGRARYPARAVALDTNPTVLRGCIALGSYIRYWSFTRDQRTGVSSKRKPGTARKNVGTEDPSPGRFRNRNRVYENIDVEERLQKMEEEERKREKGRLKGRFGIDTGVNGLTEDEMLSYAKLLSEEAWEAEKVNRGTVELIGNFTNTTTVGDNSERGKVSSSTAYPPQDGDKLNPTSSDEGQDGSLDSDIAGAIRHSLLDLNSDDAPQKVVSYRQESWDCSSNLLETSSPAKPSQSQRDYNYTEQQQQRQLFETPVKPLLSNAENDWPSPRDAATVGYKTSPHARKVVYKNDTLKNLEGDAQQIRIQSSTSKMEKERHILTDDFDADLEFAIRLSLAEEQSKRMASGSEQAHGDETFGVSRLSGGNENEAFTGWTWGKRKQKRKVRE